MTTVARDSRRPQPVWLKPAVWLACTTPLALLAWRAFEGGLGANPVEFLERALGDWSLRLLLVTLAMTPLRSLTGWPQWLAIRRLLGLWAYAYLCLHFAVYLVFDLGLLSPVAAAAQLAEDLIERTWLTLGFAAWLFLTPLAVTSTRGWQRRLGRRWKRLHRAIYPAAALGAIHYFWLVKKDVTEPLIYIAILLLLLGWRWPWPKIRSAILRARPDAPPPIT